MASTLDLELWELAGAPRAEERNPAPRRGVAPLERSGAERAPTLPDASRPAWRRRAARRERKRRQPARQVGAPFGLW